MTTEVFSDDPRVGLSAAHRAEPRFHILVRDGDGPDLAFPLDATVVRVGSHAGCGVRLDGLEGHALTVEVRSGRVRAHNRTDRRMSLDGTPLKPGSWLDWPAGSSLLVSKSLTLWLAPDADAEGGPAAVDPGVVAVAKSTEAPKGALRGPGMASLVPVLLLALVVWAFARPLGDPVPTPLSDESARFASMVGALRKQGDEGRYVAQELQLARQEQLVDRPAPARARLLRLRNKLLKDRLRAASPASVTDEALAWVKAAL